MRWSLVAQLRLGFAGAFVLALGVAAAAWWIALDYEQEITGAYETQMRTTVQLAQAQSAFWRLRFDVRQFMVEEVEAQQQVLDRQDAWYAVIEASLAAYDTTASSVEERRVLTSLRSLYLRYKQSRPRFFELWQAGEKDDATAWLKLTVAPFGEQVGQAFETQIALQQSFVEQDRVRSERHALWALALVTAMTGVLLVLLLGGYAFSQRLLRPIRALRDETRRVLRDQLGESVEGPANNNEVVALVQSFRLMSDRLGAHIESLRQSHERLDFLLGATPAVIWSSEAGGAFDRTFVSPNVQAQLGYDPAEFTASPGFWAAHIHPDDHERILDGLAAIAQCDSLTHEYRFAHKDGSWLWLHAEMRVIRDAGGAAKELIGYWIDVSARVLADEGRAQALERLQSALRGAHVALWSADEAGKIWLSPEWAGLLGQRGGDTWTTLQDLIGLAEPKDRERVRSAVVALVKGDSSEFSEEYLMRRPTGKPVWLQWQGRVSRRTAAGRVTRMSGTALDITARKQSEEQLQLLADRLALANSAKTEFMANITHELRTPLNSVIGFAELLKDEVPGPLNPKQAAFAADILAAGQRLLELVDQILAVARLDAGPDVPEAELVDVDALLQERVAAHRDAAGARGVRIALEVAANVGTARLDPAALRRMLDTLLDNAIKFNRVGGRVMVDAQREDGWLAVAIADTGIGIAPEDLERMSQPLVQVDTGLARGYGGLGLGLTLARSLALAQGGSIDIISEPGRGSTFTLRLPIGETS